MEKQKIKIIHFKSLQTLFYAGNDVFLIEIVRTGFDSALCLNEYLFTERGIGAEEVAELFFAHSAAVDIRVIEVIDAVFDIGLDNLVDLSGSKSADSHAALSHT